MLMEDWSLKFFVEKLVYFVEYFIMLCLLNLVFKILVKIMFLRILNKLKIKIEIIVYLLL